MLPNKPKTFAKKEPDRVDYQAALKAYANAHNVLIMWDIPFYVELDSLDVWGAREQFLLKKNGEPTFIAWVPPDYFSPTGQRWGNPIYDWEKMRKTGFTFWVNRLKYSCKLYDLMRIKHFRAFDTYWKIPAACSTAIDGEWVEAGKMQEALPLSPM